MTTNERERVESIFREMPLAQAVHSTLPEFFDSDLFVYAMERNPDPMQRYGVRALLEATPIDQITAEACERAVAASKYREAADELLRRLKSFSVVDSVQKTGGERLRVGERTYRFDYDNDISLQRPKVVKSGGDVVTWRIERDDPVEDEGDTVVDPDFISPYYEPSDRDYYEAALKLTKLIQSYYR